MLGGPDRNPVWLFQKGQMCVIFPLRAAFWRVPTHQHNAAVCLRRADSREPSKGLLPSDSGSKSDPMPARERLQLPLDLLTLLLSWLSSMSKQPTALAEQRPAEPNQTNLQLYTVLFSNVPFFAALFQCVEAISDYSVAWPSFPF